MFPWKAQAPAEAKNRVELYFEGGHAVVAGIREEAQVAHQDREGAEEGYGACLYHHCVESPVPQRG